jgi:hypothetical protein
MQDDIMSFMELAVFCGVFTFVVSRFAKNEMGALFAALIGAGICIAARRNGLGAGVFAIAVLIGPLTFLWYRVAQLERRLAANAPLPTQVIKAPHELTQEERAQGVL